MDDIKIMLGWVVTFSESNASQNDYEVGLLLVHDSAIDSQKSLRGGIQSPASSFGVKINFLGTIFLLLEFIKLTTGYSIFWRIFLLGRGMIAAMCVNFHRSDVLAMLTLPNSVDWTLAQAKLSFLVSLRASSQFWSRLEIDS